MSQSGSDEQWDIFSKALVCCCSRALSVGTCINARWEAEVEIKMSGTDSLLPPPSPCGIKGAGFF